MSSPPFPELDLQPIQPIDLVGQYSKILALKNMLQQQQFQQQMQPLELQRQQNELAMQQRGMQSQQAMMRALTEKPTADPDELAQTAMQYGAFPGDVLPQINQLKESAIKTQELRGKTLENVQKRADAFGQQAAMLLSIADPQRRQAIYQQQTIPYLQQLGMPGNMIPQQVPDVPSLQAHAASAMRVDDQLKQARSTQEYEQAHGIIDPARLQQMNAMLGGFAKVYGDDPTKYALSPGATWDDFARVDKLMEHTEKASATQAQLATSNAIRQQTFQLAAQGRDEQDYSRNLAELDRTFQPVTSTLPRLARLQATIAQNSPAADALIAPELLSVMSGGQGSGLRMSEAEISRIVGGRSNWENLQAAAQKWNTDPAKASSITPAQRTQIRSLVNAIADKMGQQQNVYNYSRQQLLGTSDPTQRRQIVTNAAQQSMRINTAPEAGAGGHVIQIGDKQYQYKGTGDTSDLKNYTEVTGAQR
jgi:hypothetical protein